MNGADATRRASFPSSLTAAADLPPQLQCLPVIKHNITFKDVLPCIFLESACKSLISARFLAPCHRKHVASFKEENTPCAFLQSSGHITGPQLHRKLVTFYLSLHPQVRAGQSY